VCNKFVGFPVGAYKEMTKPPLFEMDLTKSLKIGL